MRDEGPFVLDWIAHLRRIGVTRVLAYSNDCRDGTEGLLDALVPVGVIHVPQGAVRDTRPVPQWRALAQAWDHPACTSADWLLHLDPDEYIALDGPRDLPELIEASEGAEAIALPWRLFGCAGRLAPGRGSTPERFDRAAPPGLAFPALGSFFKTLFKRTGPFTGFGVHRPRQSAAPVFVDDCGHRDERLAETPDRILLWRGGEAPEGRRVQLNHYSVRSVHEFLVKRDRGLPNHVQKAIDLEYWVERNFNTTRCTMIEPQLAGIAEEVRDLRATPDVAKAEAAAIAWHADALSRILATPSGARLCGRLVLAAGSSPPEAALGRHLLDLHGRANSKGGPR